MYDLKSMKGFIKDFSFDEFSKTCFDDNFRPAAAQERLFILAYDLPSWLCSMKNLWLP